MGTVLDASSTTHYAQPEQTSPVHISISNGPDPLLEAVEAVEWCSRRRCEQASAQRATRCPPRCAGFSAIDFRQLPRSLWLTCYSGSRPGHLNQCGPSPSCWDGSDASNMSTFQCVDRCPSREESASSFSYKAHLGRVDTGFSHCLRDPSN